MDFWKRVSASIILIFISLAAFQLTRSLEVPVSTAGYLVAFTGSLAGLVAAIGIILVTLTQFFTKRAEERKREEERSIEELFTYELFHSRSADRVHELVERYKDRSTIAKTLSDPKVDDIGLAKKLLDSYSQKKVKRTVEYFLTTGKGHQALGVIIKHLIEHHKIPPYEAQLLERELKHFMPKRDIIGLYEKVK